jgi:hypothetical protein
MAVFARPLMYLLLAWGITMTASTGSPIAGESANVRQFLVYIGTYTGPNSKGIYVCRFDAATGKLTAPELAAEAINPSFIAIPTAVSSTPLVRCAMIRVSSTVPLARFQSPVIPAGSLS